MRSSSGPTSCSCTSASRPAISHARRPLRDRQQELAAALAQPTLSWIAQIEAAAWAAARRRSRRRRGTGETSTRARRAGRPARRAAGLRRAARVRPAVSGPRRRAADRAEPAGRRCIHPRMAVWSASTAQYEAHFGNHEEARATPRAMQSRAVSSGSAGTRSGSSRSRSTPTRRRVSTQHDAAALVHELMPPWQDQFVWSGALGYGHVRLWLGVAAATIGRDDEADEHFAFACRFHDDNGLQLWSARSHLGWAESLAARGERARAQEHAIARARARSHLRLRPDRRARRADRSCRRSCAQLTNSRESTNCGVEDLQVARGRVRRDRREDRRDRGRRRLTRGAEYRQVVPAQAPDA